jgi:acyl-CoA hydrolase
MEARAHNVYSGTQTVVLHTNMRFVRIDEAGDPLPIGERTRKLYSNGESNIQV